MRDIFTSDIISPLFLEKEGARVNKWLGVGSGFGCSPLHFSSAPRTMGRKKWGRWLFPTTSSDVAGKKEAELNVARKMEKLSTGTMGEVQRAGCFSRTSEQRAVWWLSLSFVSPRWRPDAICTLRV